jgi:hypothetical protein
MVSAYRFGRQPPHPAAGFIAALDLSMVRVINRRTASGAD